MNSQGFIRVLVQTNVFHSFLLRLEIVRFPEIKSESVSLVTV